MESSASPHNFGELLRRYRDRTGLTQEDLAERAGVTPEAISLLERGERRRPHAYTVRKLAEALGLSSGEQAALEVSVARGRAGTTPLQRWPTASPGRVPPPPPLVGRAQERALLERHLQEQGTPLLLLAGEPGIGKSRLLQEVARHAQDTGWCVVQGGCQRRGGQQPFAPILGALQRHIRSCDARTLRRDLQGCAWLVRLLPELADAPIDPLPRWMLEPDQERRLMVDAVVRFLSNVAGPTGTLLVLDDLQWAGRDALDLLSTLAHAATEGPLRLVGAYRDTEVRPDAPLGEMLADLAQAGLARQRRLGPLAPHEAVALLDNLLGPVREQGPGQDASGQSREQVLRRTGGVPFFLVSCAHALRAAAEGDEGDGAIPWTVTQSVQQRLAALPEGARETLSAAAVIGRVVARPVLWSVISLPAATIVSVLDEAVRVRLLEEEAGETYRFTHDVIREVVEAGVGPAQRIVLHRQVAATLAAQPSAVPLEELAYHCLEGEDWAKALTYLMQAAEKAAATYANQDAASLYGRVLAVGERVGVEALPAVVAAAEKRGWINMYLTNIQEATADYNRMREAAQRLGDRYLEARALVLRGIKEYENHEFAASEETLRAALSLAGDERDDIRYDASALLAVMYLDINRHAEARPLAQLALELRPRVNTAINPHLSGMLAMFIPHWAGRYGDAIEAAEYWRRWAEETWQAGVHFLFLCVESLVRASKGEYQRALTLLEEIRSIDERTGERNTNNGRYWNTLGWVHGELQDHTQAIAYNRRGVEAALDLHLSDAEVESNARLNLGDSLMALGRLDDAVEQFERVQQVVRNPRPEDQWMLWRYAQHLFHSYGELWLLRGDATKAWGYADECLALAVSSDSRKNVVKARRLRGQALMAHGQLVDADRELAQALEVARQVGNPPQLWKTLVAVGELRHAQGRGDEAGQMYQEAVQVIDAVAQGLDDPDLRATFLTSPHVQQIRQRAQPRVPLSAPVTPPAEASQTRRVSRTERQAWAVQRLQADGSISPRAYAAALGVSVDTALLDLRELMARGLVQAEGTTKDRRYRLRRGEG